MHQFGICIHLLDNLIISERNATEGAHRCLDYIPGACILGIVARSFYADPAINHDQAYTFFHSGRLRFGNGLPLIINKAHIENSHICYPMSLSWFTVKSEQAKLAASQIIYCENKVCLNDETSNEQAKQYRSVSEPFFHALDETQISSPFYSYSPLKHFHLKTALNPGTRVASDSQLFGYESLPAGLEFYAMVELDQTLAEQFPDLLEQLKNTLVGQKSIGRSRSAEYGNVQIAVHDESSLLKKLSNVTSAQLESDMVLYCVSDLALVDDKGQPTLNPTPENLLRAIIEDENIKTEMLASIKVDWSRTFIKPRTYSAYLSHQQAYDIERQVIRQGSVVTLKLDRLKTELKQTLVECFKNGIGLFKSSGLGKIWINPDFLMSKCIELQSAHTDSNVFSLPVKTHIETDAVIRFKNWFKSEVALSGSKINKENINELLDELKKCYRLAKTFQGKPDYREIGPSPSQWGAILKATRETPNSFKQLEQKLFCSKDACCKQNQKGWCHEFQSQNKNKEDQVISFHEWLKDYMREKFKLKPKDQPTTEKNKNNQDDDFKIHKKKFILFIREAMTIAKNKSFDEQASLSSNHLKKTQR